MPLPLGYSAIGFATHCLISKNTSTFNQWKLAIFIIILSNLPDIDVLFGLILQSNGSAFHRGPTHSILFALTMGLAASKFSRLWSQIPVISFKICFFLILSHVVADYFLTNSPVSSFWPLEVSWSTGNFGWSQVLHTVFFNAMEDDGIVLICTIFIMAVMILRRFYFSSKAKLIALTVWSSQSHQERRHQSIQDN
jgi:membrane-bound metal-dependent hydrolase YbcI (DUF457 family)